MAILVLFEQFPGKFCLVLAPNFECFTKYDAFCLHSFDHACLRQLRHDIVMKRIKIMAKFDSSKALLKMVGGGMHPPHPPGSAPVHPFNLQILPQGAKWLAFTTTLW